MAYFLGEFQCAKIMEKSYPKVLVCVYKDLKSIIDLSKAKNDF